VAWRIFIAGLLIAVAAGGAVWLHNYETSSTSSFRDTSNCVLRNGLGIVEERGPLVFLQQTQDDQPGRDLTITCTTGTASTRSHPSWADPVAVAGAIVLVSLGLALVVPALMRERRTA
jgi:hypothetical protein